MKSTLPIELRQTCHLHPSWNTQRVFTQFFGWSLTLENRWDGMGWDGMGWDGMGWDGMGWDGMGWDGMGWDGMGWDGMGWDGMGWDGMGWDGMGWGDGMGWDRTEVEQNGSYTCPKCLSSKISFLSCRNFEGGNYPVIQNP